MTENWEGFASVSKAVARSFAMMAWGSGTVEDWQARCAHSQRLSERRRVSTARDQRRRSEACRQALAGFALAVVALTLLVLLKMALG